MNKRQKWLAAVLALVLLAGGAAAFVFLREETVNRTDFLMDTFVQQKITGRKAAETGDAVYQTLKHLDDTLSLYDADSEIAQINEGSGRQAVAVSEMTYTLIKRAVELSRQSGGVFDLTVAPVTLLWHEAKEALTPPAQEDVASRLALVDSSEIAFDDEKKTVMLLKEGMGLDLGGIAKGYATDLVKDIYQKADISHALVSIGGNIYSYGAPSGKKDYTIGIRDPLADASTPLLTLSITDRIIATSGAYERYFEADGVSYHHIIDTATGWPAETDLLSLTVVSQDGALADCMSTTLYVNGLDGVKAVLAKEAAGETLPYAIIAVDKEHNVYVSSSLRERVALYEENDNQYRIQPAP